MDTPIHRKLFIEMTIKEQDELLNGIRARRLAPVQRYQELVGIRKKAKDQKTLDQIERLCNLIDKAIAAVDTKIDVLEKNIIKLHGMKLLMEIDDGPST